MDRADHRRLPQVFSKTWTTPGTYTVMAKGFSDCTGQVTTTVTVAGEAPAPDPAADLVTASEVPPAAASVVTLEDDETSNDPSSTSPSDEPPLPLTSVTIYVDLNGSGSGSVTGSASCTGAAGMGCAASVVDGANMTLTAAATAGSVFTGWSGACTGTSPTCTLTAFDHALAVANFRAAPAPVLQYYHVDSLGSVRAVTDASGAVLERHDYRPFGEDNQSLPAPRANSARFLGQQRDQTKLDYFGARYVDMHTGRFGGVDPVLSPTALSRPQQFNRYAYAENNPLAIVDTTGLEGMRELGPTNEDGSPLIDYSSLGHNICMDTDEECGHRGFDNFVDDYYNTPIGSEFVDSDGQKILITNDPSDNDYGLTYDSVKEVAAESYSEGTHGTVDEYQAVASTVFNRVDEFNSNAANNHYTTVEKQISISSHYQGYGSDSFNTCLEAFADGFPNPADPANEHMFDAMEGVAKVVGGDRNTTATNFLWTTGTPTASWMGSATEVGKLSPAEDTKDGTLYLYTLKPKK